MRHLPFGPSSTERMRPRRLRVLDLSPSTAYCWFCQSPPVHSRPASATKRQLRSGVAQMAVGLENTPRRMAPSEWLLEAPVRKATST